MTPTSGLPRSIFILFFSVVTLIPLCSPATITNFSDSSTRLSSGKKHTPTGLTTLSSVPKGGGHFNASVNKGLTPKKTAVTTRKLNNQNRKSGQMSTLSIRKATSTSNPIDTQSTNRSQPSPPTVGNVYGAAAIDENVRGKHTTTEVNTHSNVSFTTNVTSKYILPIFINSTSGPDINSSNFTSGTNSGSSVVYTSGIYNVSSTDITTITDNSFSTDTTLSGIRHAGEFTTTVTPRKKEESSANITTVTDGNFTNNMTFSGITNSHALSIKVTSGTNNVSSTNASSVDNVTTGRTNESSVDDATTGRTNESSVDDATTGRTNEYSVDDSTTGRTNEFSVDNATADRTNESSVDDATTGRTNESSVDDATTGRTNEYSVDDSTTGRTNESSVDDATTARTNEFSVDNLTTARTNEFSVDNLTTARTNEFSVDNLTTGGTNEFSVKYASTTTENSETQTPVAPFTENQTLSENNDTTTEITYSWTTENTDTETTSTDDTTTAPPPKCPNSLTIPPPTKLWFNSKEMTAEWEFNESEIANPAVQVERFTINYYYLNDSTESNPVGTTLSSKNKNVAINDLAIFSKYRICVAVVTNCNDSDYICENITTKPGIPDEPANVSVVDIGPFSFRVSWIPTGNDPGPTEYKVFINSTDGRSWVTRVPGLNNRTVEINGLYPFTVYCVYIQANTTEGSSKLVTVPCVRTNSAEPETPTSLTSDNVTPHGFVARWTPSGKDPGPTTYTIHVTQTEGTSAMFVYNVSVSGYSATGAQLSDLKPFSTYCFVVSAKTEAGESIMSDRYCCKTKPTKPSAIKNLTGNCTSSMCTFQWLPPENMNGILEHYQVVFDPSSNVAHSQRTFNNSITIAQLKPRTNYTIKVSTKIKDVIVEGDPVSLSLLTHDNPESSISGVLASLVTLIVIGLIFGIVVLIMKWKNKILTLGHLRRYYHSECETQTSETNMAIPIRATAKPVQLGDFEEHLRMMTLDSGLKFSQEFEELNNISPTCPTAVAQMPENRPKNRWINILPFDHARVKLLPIADDVSSDYINASYIPGYHSQREYIASQGPLPGTKEDFWRMIWEQNCSTIVMVTQLVERGKIKCEAYWPTNTEMHNFGDLLVTLKTEDVRKSYVTRVFTIQLKNTTFSRPASSIDISDQTDLIPQNLVFDQGSRLMEVKQLHFTMWPDFGCPENTSKLINFVKAVRKAVNQSSLMGPIVVHCSAGVGRTGTFIAVDIIMHHIEENDYVDVYGIVRAMRHYRSNMVQTEDQYVFIHDCAKDLIREMVPQKKDES